MTILNSTTTQKDSEIIYINPFLKVNVFQQI